VAPMMMNMPNNNTGAYANNQTSVGQTSVGQTKRGDPNLKLFIGGVPKTVADDEFWEYFSSFGVLDDCILMRDQDGICRGFGFVTYQTQDAYQKVFAAQLQMRGKPLEQKKALPPSDVEQKKSGVKVFLGGLSAEVDKEKIRNFFSQYGEVVDAVVMKDATTGNPRGFGFVTFANTDSVDELMKNPRFDFCGKSIQCKRAQSAATLNRLNWGRGGFRGGFAGRASFNAPSFNAPGFGRERWRPPYAGPIRGGYPPRGGAGRFRAY